MRFKHLILGCVFLIAACCLASDNAPLGFLEGRLRILAAKEVELAEGNASKFSADYAEYPLIILSQDGKKEIAACNGGRKWKLSRRAPSGRLHPGCARTAGLRVTSARNRNRSQVVSNQTVHVDMDIDTGVR